MKIASLPEEDRNTLEAVCVAGVRGASQALATFLGASDATLSTDLSEVEAAGEIADRVPHGEDGVTVGFALSGEASGVLLFSCGHDAAATIAGRLLRTDPASTDLDDGRVQGALAEVGNIVASAFLNAISERVGAPCLPSVPELVRGAAEGAVPAALAHFRMGDLEAGAFAISVELGAPLELSFALAFVPDAKEVFRMVERVGSQARVEA